MDEASVAWREMGRLWPEEHPAKIVEAAVNQWETTVLEHCYQHGGSAAYPPLLMLKLALYEILRGQGSPHAWARDVRENEPLRWLVRGITPSSRACYRFRDRAGKFIEALHAQLICQVFAEGLVQPRQAAQDGTMFRGGASRHRLVNQKTLNKRRPLLEAAIEADQHEQPLPRPQPNWMPTTPAGRRQLQERMVRAGTALDQRLAHNARRRKSHRLQEDHVFVSVSDPEAAISRDKEKIFGPLYTAQHLVDYHTGLVLGFSVEATATDVGTLAPMIDKVQPWVGGRLEQVSTDASYATVIELAEMQARHINLLAPVQENSWTEQKKKARKGVVVASNRADFQWLPEEQTYRCPQGHHLEFQWKEQVQRAGGRTVTQLRYHCPAQHCQGCPQAATCVRNPQTGRVIKRLEGQELLDAQREKMKQPENKAIYRQRGAVVERSFADVKQHRDGRRLHGRGLLRAIAEVGLMVLTQNILTLFRLRQRTANRLPRAA